MDKRDIFLTYPGGKSGSGTYQKLINLMPPHRMYVECFLGGGAILRAKKPALVNVGIDLDKTVVQEWNFIEWRGGIPNLTVYWADSVQWLKENASELAPDTLVYADPPYLMSTRSTQKQLYVIEMGEEEQHRALIDVLRSLTCMVMLSGYWSELYADLLSDWRTYSFQSMTRSGKMATEWVWMNYPEPFALHDYQYLGETFRQRERIKRKKARWQARLEKMPALERQALLMAIDDLRAGNAVTADDAATSDDAGGNDAAGDAAPSKPVENAKTSDGRRPRASKAARVASSASGDDAGGDDGDDDVISTWKNGKGEFAMPLQMWLDMGENERTELLKETL